MLVHPATGRTVRPRRQEVVSMGLAQRIGRTVAALTLVATVVGGVEVAGASSASASTIPDGKIQLCSQGNYWSFIHILSRSLNDVSSTLSMASFLVRPGDCYITSFNTLGGANQVDVVGLRPDGSEFYIGSQWWNSVTGLGIGAEGTPEHPYIWTW